MTDGVERMRAQARYEKLERETAAEIERLKESEGFATTEVERLRELAREAADETERLRDRVAELEAQRAALIRASVPQGETSVGSNG